MAMEKKYFVINTGSASRKYALFSETGERLFFAHYEKENGGFIVNVKSGEANDKKSIAQEEYEKSTEAVIREMIGKKAIADKSEISGIGLRIVAAGSYFLKHQIIDAAYRTKLAEAQEWAPLHIAPIIRELQSVDSALPGIPVAGISDSAYHAQMPEYSRLYAIPYEASRELDVMRFGYHGISFKSIFPKLESLSRVATAKAIVCHLGSGSSVMAFKDGKSIDTSMGFTPLEGLPMATRVGDIDSGAVICLEKKLGLSFDKMEGYLNSQCGLFGVSGKTDDVRELLDLEAAGDERAKLALQILVYKIKKYIGAYFAALNGVDILVFSGTIGERSSIIRSRICREMDALGIAIDEERNGGTISRDGFIHHEGSSVKIAVITTDEMGEIAKETLSIIK